MNIEVYSNGKLHVIVTDKSCHQFDKKNYFYDGSRVLQDLIDNSPDKAVQYLERYKKIENEKIIFKLIALLASYR